MKKIFILIMSVLMICAAAVPAFAETSVVDPNSNKIDTVSVNIVDYDGTYTTKTIEVPKTPAVKNVLKLITEVSYSTTKGTITSVNGKTSEDINSPFDGKWVVAVNGKITNFETSIKAGDILTIYWNEPALNTRLVQVERIQADVFRFFYYNGDVKTDLVNVSVSMKYDNDPVIDSLNQSNSLITDERGQVWIAPFYLDDPNKVLTIESVNLIEIDTIGTTNDKYTDAEREYFNNRSDKSLIDCDVVNREYTTNFLVDTPATGDMTLVYVGVAIVALTALAIIIVKKKENK